MADRARTTVETNSGSLQVIRRPRSALEDDERARLLAACVAVAHSGFGTTAIPESDVALHAIDVDYGLYLFDPTGGLVGFSSAKLLEMPVGSPSASPSRILYLEGTAIGRQRQGAGAYYPFILARCALGLSFGATYLVTRTANPRVCRALRHFNCYPFGPDSELSVVAGAVAQYAYDHLSDFQHPAGLTFDPITGVVSAAYEGAMSPDVNWSGDAAMDSYFRTHVNFANGDAVLVAAHLDSARCDALARRHLGRNIADAVALLGDIVDS